jgi:hypothetical protein
VQLLRSRAALLLLLLLALYPLFRDLGGTLLWEDEGDTAVFARQILATGLPTAWDGRSFLDSDYGFRVVPHALGRDFVMMGTPWLPYYATAGSFALLGESTTAARLPFALAALVTLALLHAFVLRATGSRRAAFAAVLLLLASTQFLLYARECRSYAFNMLFTTGVLYGFLRLGAHRRDLWLAVAAVLLFHSQILPAAIALAACGALALLHPRFRSRLGVLLLRAPWVMALTVPWLALGWSEVGANWSPLASAFELPARVAQLAAESMVAIPWLAWLVAIPRLWPRLRAGDRDLLAIAGCYVLGVFALLPLALSKDMIVVVGLRYACGLLPVAAAVTGVVVARASDGRPLRFAALLALFAATHLAGNALPWLALGQSARLPLPGTPFVHVPSDASERIFNTTWWRFVRGLGTPNPGTVSALVEFVNGSVGAEEVLVTNFGGNNLYFYTNRRQGFGISPDAAAVRDAAKAAGLPAYVFGLEDARWLIWRPGADPLPNLPFEKVRATLEASGARLEPVASFRETLWENRPELHWHRFADGRYFAPRKVDAEGRIHPDAVAYRIVRGTDPAP